MSKDNILRIKEERTNIIKKQSCGLDAKVINYINSDNILVEFSDGELCETTWDTFQRRAVRHSSSYAIEDMCKYIRVEDERLNADGERFRVIGFDGDNVIVKKLFELRRNIVFSIDKSVYAFGNFDNFGNVVVKPIRQSIHVGDRKTNRCGKMAQIEYVGDNFITISFFRTGPRQVFRISYIDWYCHTFYHPKDYCYGHPHNKLGVGFYWHLPDNINNICEVIRIEYNKETGKPHYIVKYRDKEYRLGTKAIARCMATSPFMEMSILDNIDKGQGFNNLGCSRVGETVVFKNGCEGRIVDYRSYLDIDIEVCGTVLKHFRYYNFKDGYDIQSWIDAPKEGDVIEMMDGTKGVIQRSGSLHDLDILREDGLLFEGVPFLRIKQGYLGLSEEEKKKSILSRTYYNKVGIPLRVLDYENLEKIQIEFLDGYKEKVTHIKLVSGGISHPTFKLVGNNNIKKDSTFCSFDILSRVSKLNKPGYIYYQCKCRNCNEEFILTPTKMLAHKC